MTAPRTAAEPLAAPGTGAGGAERRRGGGPRPRLRHVLGRAGEITPGQRKIVSIGRVSVGLFNVDGAYHAVANVCPHQGAPLCLGPLTGTHVPSEPYVYTWGLEQRVLRCPWHGWEFDVTTGRSLFDPQVRTRRFDVVVEEGELVVYA